LGRSPYGSQLSAKEGSGILLQSVSGFLSAALTVSIAWTLEAVATGEIFLLIGLTIPIVTL